MKPTKNRINLRKDHEKDTNYYRPNNHRFNSVCCNGSFSW
ncbi:hypothetical protein VCHA36O157_50120 [Vibrio chagasii]|nr:hypothetical protein VCHA34P115_50121 [Vibrio chagasii]CAH6992969.1 hypothetical protein VCHA36O157_50120 [Vibrio chagasii]CAH7020737.1 hypothetical protein VCHA43O270_10115 [Vibrio chagasii]CAH7024918.1 hypothetical protein VCHA29O37_40271 [Vibrio chagasii]CAH7031992.1 hypothetical protein VCHA53O466_170037 [Vibrio chagasii]